MTPARLDEDEPALVSVLVEVPPFHLDRPFDYLLGAAPEDIAPGWRVEVNFSGRRRRGLVVGRPRHSDVPRQRLRAVKKVLGTHVWMTPEELELVSWAATRWCAPRSDVIRHALPGRAVRVEEAFAEQGLLPWTPASALAAGGRSLPGDDAALGRGVALERDAPAGHAGPTGPGDPATTPPGWEAYGGGQELFTGAESGLASGGGPRVWRPLPDEDVAARLAEVIAATLRAGRDAMVLAPDAGSRIAAGLVTTMRRQLDDLGLDRDHVVDVMGLSTPSAITRAWLTARTGRARLVVGERRVAFWPLVAPGLFVVLDEANPGHKERRSPRHHVREVVLERARRSDAVALLTTWVPSAPTWRLMRDGRVGAVVPPRPAEVAAAPDILVDADHRVRLGRTGIGAIRDAITAGDHAIVLAARRGEGRAMVCRDCGDRPVCPTCGSSLAGQRQGLGCPRCGWSTPRRRCRECGGREFVPLAAGTQRLATELERTVDAPVAVLEGYDADAPPPPSVLVMTRGSVLDRPPGPVGAVVVGDLDALVMRPTVDAPEDTMRLLFTLGSWLAVGSSSGRGRARMVVVTRDPEALVPTTLRRWDPGAFWRHAAPERTPFPPATTALAVATEEASVAAALVQRIAGEDDIALGPVATGGRHRVLLLTHHRVPLVARLAEARVELSRDNVALSVDVEPVDLG